MPGGAPVALAIGVGYVLGRSHKLRWALILGAAAASGRMGGLSTQALQRGGEMLRSNPELAKLTDSATGLLQAGRTAAVSAMKSRTESLTGALEDKAGDLESAGDKATKTTKAAGERTKDAVGRGKTKDAEAEAKADVEDEYDEADEAEDDQGAEDEEGTEDEEEDEEEEDEEEEDEEEEDEAEAGDEAEADEPPPTAGSGRAVRRTGSRR